MDNPIFGLQGKNKLLKDYRDKYVILYPQNASNFSGKIVDIDEFNYIVLNPYQGVSYDKEKGAIRLLIDEPARVRLGDVIAIEPVTRENLENFCEFKNNQDRIDLEIKLKSLSSPKSN